MTVTTTERPKAKVPAPIDPRMRARRVAVRRHEGRRRLYRLVVIVVIAAVAGCAYLVTRSPFLDVDRVRIEGASHANPEALRAVSAIKVGSPMTAADLGRAEVAIAASPWIDTVRVTRDWPGTIEIHVTERSVSATLLGSRGEWFLADDTGRVLEPAEGPAADRPTIAVAAAVVAPGAAQPDIGGALDVVRRLTPDLEPWVQAVQPAADGSVDLLLRGGIRVELGTQAHMGDKLVDLATVLTRVDLTDLETIDLSVMHTPVVTRGPS